MSRQTVDIAAVIDSNKVGAFQVWILVVVGLTVVIDGIDVQAMGYVAPAIIQDWGISKASLGPVFGAGLFGMLIGSLALSILADRIGRRPVLIGATVFFGIMMFAAAHATTLDQLLVLRFIAGLGLGGIMPNAMALAGEYSPRRQRVSFMMWVSCGFTVGAVLGGLLSSVMIPAWGWQSVFYLGAAIPIVLAVLMVYHVPESMQFLALRGRDTSRVGACLRRIDPSLRTDRDTRWLVAEAKGGAPVIELFRDGRAVGTVLLWVINFMNLVNLYFLSSWLPAIAKSAGLSLSTAVLVGTMLQVGGVIGTVAMGPVIDRIGFYKVLVPVFIVAAIAVAAIGQPGISLLLLFTVVTITGLCIIGGQPAVNALAATYYPTSQRSTGIGWSLGVGRVGSIIGPVLGGELIRRNWSTGDIFLAMAVPAAISALMLLLMGLDTRARTTPRAGVAAAPLSH